MRGAPRGPRTSVGLSQLIPDGPAGNTPAIKEAGPAPAATGCRTVICGGRPVVHRPVVETAGPEYRDLMNAGKAPPAVTGPTRRPANFESTSRFSASLRPAKCGKRVSNERLHSPPVGRTADECIGDQALTEACVRPAALGSTSQAALLGRDPGLRPAAVKTCFAVGAVLRVCEVFRFLLEHRSSSASRSCSCCSSERGASSVGECFCMAARKQEPSQSSRWKCR